MIVEIDGWMDGWTSPRGTGTYNTKWRIDYTALCVETSRLFLNLTHFWPECKEIKVSFSFNFMLFSWSETIRVGPTRTGSPSWSGPTFVPASWIREFLPLGAPVNVFLISSLTERWESLQSTEWTVQPDKLFYHIPNLNKLLGNLSTCVFETRTVTGSELFSLLTCPHTTIFTLPSMFSSWEIRNMEIWATR